MVPKLGALSTRISLITHLWQQETQAPPVNCNWPALPNAAFVTALVIKASADNIRVYLKCLQTEQAIFIMQGPFDVCDQNGCMPRQLAQYPSVRCIPAIG